MPIFVKTVRTVFRRPFIVLFWSIISLIYCFIDYSVSKVLFSIALDEGTNMLENLIHFIQVTFNFFTDPNILVSKGVYFIAFIVFISVPLALIFSGYLHVVNNGAARRKSKEGEFFEGIKKHFITIWLITLRALFLGVIFVIFVIVACVPAMIITQASLMDQGKISTAALFVDVLTFSVLYFGCLFFRIYIFLWYPAALNQKKNAFPAAKKLADENFWKLAGGILIFDVIYFLFSRLMASVGNLIVLFVLNWIFNAVFFSLFIVYIFAAYRVFKTRKQAS